MDSTATTGGRRSNWGLGLAALLAVLPFLPAVGGEPIWDDAIVFERYLPTFGGIGDAFVPPPGAGELGEFYYRPLVTISYLIDAALFGSEHFVGHHLTTILLHLLSVLGVGLLTRGLLTGHRHAGLAAGAAACSFAVHPVHVESVAQITGRCDPMAAAFVLAAMLAVLHGRQRHDLRWPWWLAGGMFFAALLSKEVSAVAIGLGALLLWLPRRVPAALWWRFGISFGSVALLYLVLRANADLGSTPLLAQSVGDAASRLLRALAFDANMLLLPLGQAAFVPLEHTPPAWLGGLVAAGLAAVALLAWRWCTSWPVVAVAWCWGAATLLPVLALVLVKASEQPVAERWLYLPSVAISLAFGAVVAWWRGRAGGSRVVMSVVAVGVLAAAVTTGLRARIYVDNETFWTDTVAKAEGAALPLYQLGLTQRKAGRLDEARVTLERALALYDDDEGRSLAQNTIGTIHIERRQWAEAERWLRASATTRPGYATPWFNLAGVYGMRGGGLADLEACLQALDQAIARRSDYRKARQQLTQVLARLGQTYQSMGRMADAQRMQQRLRAAKAWLAQNGG